MPGLRVFSAFAFAFVLFATVRLHADICESPGTPAFAAPASVCAGSSGVAARPTSATRFVDVNLPTGHTPRAQKVVALTVPEMNAVISVQKVGTTLRLSTTGDTSDMAHLWSTGAITPSIDVTAPGTYSVTVTNQFGSSASAAVTVYGTPAGSNVTTVSGAVTLSFTQVAFAGLTTILPIAPWDTPPLPSGFEQSPDPMAFDIISTARFESAPALITMVKGFTFGNKTYRIVHVENDVPVDCTTSIDPIAGTITCTVKSLSPFVLAIKSALQLSVVAAPADPVFLGIAINASATFTDESPGLHTATIAWGDGTTSAGAVTESGGAGSVQGSHVYASAGVYPITIAISNTTGGETASQTFQYVVVYDPYGGFVTGSGQIESPAGAIPSKPLVTGKAKIGVGARYSKKASVPTGTTDLSLSVGSFSFNFNSTSYEWLVVSGARAQYQGRGKVDGAGDYGFLLTVVAGKPDRLRLKIWNRNGGAIVYDNQMNAANDADLTTALTGGSIAVHP
jgi:hypothetical protein